MRRAGGFTVLEALLAGMILAISAVAIGVGMSRSMEALQLARDYDEAAVLLERVMKRIDLLGPDRVIQEGPTSGRFSEPYEKYAWEAAVETTEYPDLYEVQVTVSWTSAGRSRSAQVHTRLMDELDSRPGYLEWEEL